MNILRGSTIGLLLLSMLALGCSDGGREASAPVSADGAVGYDVAQSEAAPAAAPAPPRERVEQTTAARQAERPDIQADTAPSGSTPAPQMIIRNGTATVRVEKLEPAVARVKQLAERLGGYVANTSMESGDEGKVATLELKIPAARFEQAVTGLAPVGTLEEQLVTAQDVGEEYTDVAARMANARRLEERLLTLLETRTGRLEDVLSVERELARVRGEIESAEGRLRYLRSRVSLSTLTVRLREGGYPAANPIMRAFREAWRNFVDFVAGFIQALGWLTPLLIVLAILWRVVRWLFGSSLARHFAPGRTDGPPPPPPPTGESRPDAPRP
jgi:hypothetical protein